MDDVRTFFETEYEFIPELKDPAESEEKEAQSEEPIYLPVDEQPSWDGPT